MAGEHIPQEWAGWASILGGATIVLGGVAGAVAFVRRSLNTAFNAWRKGDADLTSKMEANETEWKRRLTDLGGNAVREVEAIRHEFKARQDLHDVKDDERFAIVHRRLDDLVETVARRDDMARVERKIDQLLLDGNRREREG